MTRMRVTWMLILILTGQGCTSSHLILSTYTKVGLEVSSTGGKPTQAVFGYKRFEGASIPVDEDVEEGKEREAMSTFVAMEVENSWLSGLEIRQVFATGHAAVNAVDQTQITAKLLAPTPKKSGAKE